MVRMADLARSQTPEQEKKADEKVEPESPEKDELQLRDLPGLNSLYQDLRRVFSAQESESRPVVEEEVPATPPPAQSASPPPAQPAYAPPAQPATPPPAQSATPPPAQPAYAPPAQSETVSSESLLTPTEEAGGQVQAETQVAQSPEDDFEVLYDKAYNFLFDVIADVSNGRDVTLNEGALIVARMINSPGAVEALYRKAISLSQDYEQLSSHLTNVSIYTIKLGQGLNYRKEELFQLGISGMFYDIGLAKVPDRILNKPGKFTEEERDLMSQHTQYGYDLLSAALPKEPWLAEVALEHHERENGEGYPQQLSGEEIHDYAKVIGLADIYDAATRARPYKKRKLPFQAVREILRTERGKFPQPVLKVLLVKLSVFPTGSYIRLNSGAIGVVVEVNEVAPLRPKVELLYDSQGRKLRERKAIDLQQTSILHIVAPVDEEELPKD